MKAGAFAILLAAMLLSTAFVMAEDSVETSVPAEDLTMGTADMDDDVVNAVDLDQQFNSSSISNSSQQQPKVPQQPQVVQHRHQVLQQPTAPQQPQVQQPQVQQPTAPQQPQVQQPTAPQQPQVQQPQVQQPTAPQQPQVQQPQVQQPQVQQPQVQQPQVQQPQVKVPSSTTAAAPQKVPFGYFDVGAAASKCNELLPGYLEALARAQEMVQTYTKQMSSLCSREESANLKNVQVPSELIEMIDNAPPTIEALSDDTMLAKVGHDRCKLVYLLITSNSKRVESLENTIEGIRAQCQASSCASDNRLLHARIANMEADFKAKLNEANKENAMLKSQKAGLEKQVQQLTSELGKCKSASAQDQKLLQGMSSQLNSCMSESSKVKGDLAACNRGHDVTKVGYNECREQLKAIGGNLDGEKTELAKCNAREKVALKEKAAVQAQLDGQVAKNKVLEEKAKCTADKSLAKSLQADVVKCNGKVSALTGNVQKLQTQVGVLAADKLSLSKQVGTLQVEGKKKSVTIASQSKSIDDLNKKAQSLSGTVTTLEGKLKTASQNLGVCSTELKACNEERIANGADCGKKLSVCHETIKHCDKKKVDLIEMYMQQIKDAAAASEKARVAAAKIAAAQLAACRKDADAASRDAAAKLGLATNELKQCTTGSGLLKDNLSKCQSSHDRCTQAVATLTGSNAALTSQVATLKTEIDNLLKKHHITNSKCQRELGNVKSELASSQATLKECTKNRNAAVLEAESLRKIREHLEEKVSSLTNDVQAKALDLKARLEKIQSLERDLKIDTDKFKAADKQRQDLQSQVDNLRKEMAQDEAEIAALQNKYDSLTDKTSKEGLDLKAKLDKSAVSMADKVKKMKEMQASMGARIKELSAMDATLKARVKELEGHRDLHSKTVAEKEKLEHSLAILKQIRDQNAKDLKDRTDLAVELQKKLDALTQSCQSAGSSLRAALNQCNVKTKALSKEVATVQARHRKTAAELDASETKLRAASLKLADATAEVANRKRSEAKLVSQLLKCRNSKKACRQSKKSVEQQLSVCGKKQSEFRQMVKDLESRHNRATTDLLKRLAKAEADGKFSAQKLTVCKGERDNLSAESKQVSKDLASQKRIVATTKDQLAVVTARNKVLQTQIADRSSQIKKLESAMEGKKVEVNKLKKAIADMGNVDSKKIKEMVARINTLNAEIKAHQAAKKKLQSENLSLSNMYKQGVKTIAQLRKKAVGDSKILQQYSLKIASYKKELDIFVKNSFLIEKKLAATVKLVSGLKKQRDKAAALAKKYKSQLDQIPAKDKEIIDDSAAALLKYREQIAKLNRTLQRVNKRLQRANSVKKNLKGLLREHKVMVSGLRKMLKSRPSLGEFNELNNAFKASRATIRALKARLRKLAKPTRPRRVRPTRPSKSRPTRPRRVRRGEDSHTVDGGDEHHVEINIHQLQELEDAADAADAADSDSS